MSDKPDKVCVGCKKPMINGVHCSVCQAPFHVSCAKNCGPLPNGAYTKCCRPSSPALLTPSTSDTPTTIADMERIIGSAVKSLKSEIAGVSSSLSDKIDNVAAVMENRMVDAERKIVDLTERVNSIEGTINSLSSNDSNLERNCLAEFETRFIKKKNLILFRAPEQNNFLEKLTKTSRNEYL